MQRAFSLVELSIVLVILGLLTGGILAGQSLIRAAELRSVSSEYARYATSVNTFRDKYFQLPGDMNNATKFWGAAHATPATCRTTSSTTQATCDGDGNGNISTMDGSVTYSEYFRAWQHLANAGLIEGSYTGVACTAGVACSRIGENAPASKLNNGGYSFAYLPAITSTADPNWFASRYGNFLWFGAYTSADLSGSALKPEEAWNIDTKMDDSIPSTGRILMQKSGGINCYASAGAVYALTSTAIACHFIMLL